MQEKFSTRLVLVWDYLEEAQPSVILLTLKKLNSEIGLRLFLLSRTTQMFLTLVSLSQLQTPVDFRTS